MITSITAETLGEQVRITVQATEVMEYTAFIVHNPPRLVLTCQGQHSVICHRPLPVAGVVRSIEPLYVPEEQAVRVVLSLQVSDHACRRNPRPSGAGHSG